MKAEMSTATEWNVAVGIYGTPLQRYTAFNPSWVCFRRDANTTTRMMTDSTNPIKRKVLVAVVVQEIRMHHAVLRVLYDVRRRRVSLHFAHPMVMNQNDGDKHPPSV
ncbi:unnamed protein product, partial [Fusarium graminearum]